MTLMLSLGRGRSASEWERLVPSINSSRQCCWWPLCYKLLKTSTEVLSSVNCQLVILVSFSQLLLQPQVKSETKTNNFVQVLNITRTDVGEGWWEGERVKKQLNIQRFSSKHCPQEPVQTGRLVSSRKPMWKKSKMMGRQPWPLLLYLRFWYSHTKYLLFIIFKLWFSFGGGTIFFTFFAG